MSSLLLGGVLLAVLAVGRRQLANLREVGRSPATTHEPADLSVVVPARNEATTLPALLTSLQLLSTAVREVVVVDDGSEDDTADVARAGGATVVTAPAPPPGWTGKSWACHLGAGAASGRLLLFLDADTVLASDALAGLLGLHRRHGGLVSVQPFHRVVRAYEQLSSYFNLVSLIGSGAFARRPSSRPMAFGPCLLTSRADYERSGGHAGVSAEILDDGRLAAAYALAGMPVHCAIGGQRVQMRMYPAGPQQLVEGWTKNIASGAGQADHRSAAVAALWVAAHFAVAVGAGLAVAGAFVDVAAVASGTSWLWALSWVAVSWQLRSLLRRIGSFSWWTWAAFPVPLLVFGALFVRSVVLTHVQGSVRWRGRTVLMPGRRSGLEDG